MEAIILQESYQNYKHRTIDLNDNRLAWIDATLDFGFKLHKGRQDFHNHDREFSIWLDHNSLKEINRDDRAGFIFIGEYPAVARQVMTETNLTSIKYIGAAIKRRVRHLANPVSKKSKKKKVKPIENKAFVRRLLAALRRKRKEVRDVEITRKWRPEAISVMDLHEILGWLEESLEEFIKTGGSSIGEDADALGGQDVSNYQNRITPINPSYSSAVFANGEGKRRTTA